MRLLSPYRKQNAKVSRLLTNFFRFFAKFTRYIAKITCQFAKFFVFIRKKTSYIAKATRLIAKKIIITYENKLIGLSYFPDLNAIKLKCFICNCFHSKYNLCDFYFVLLLVSMVKLNNHKIHPPHWFQCCT